MTDTTPSARHDHPKFADCDPTKYKGTDLMLVIAARYEVPEDEKGGAIIDPERDRKRAEEAVALNLFAKVEQELIEALETLGNLLVYPMLKKLSGAEVEYLNHVHHRFWQAKRASESLSKLLVWYLMNPEAGK